MTLKFGQTPFDHMPPDEIKAWAVRAYAALVASQSAMRLCRDPSSRFWQADPGGSGFNFGTGFAALSKADAVLAAVHEKHDSGEVYDAFYRYAQRLLFGSGPEWFICAAGCGRMAGLDQPGGPPAACHNCGAPYRPLTLDDLRPQE